MTPRPTFDEYFIDPLRVRRTFDAAAHAYDRAAAVHGEIRSRLLERLDVVRIEPKTVLDLGTGTGAAAQALKKRYPHAHVVALDVSAGMLQHASRRQGWWRRFSCVQADANRICLKSSSLDLVFSSFMLQWCNEPDRTFAEIRRVLRMGGLLTFATLGPDTLKELREAWRTVDARTHVHRFIDMHDLGDALMRAGFAQPVMDTERVTITYPSPDALFDELRATGSRNLTADRPRGLGGKAKAAALRRQLEARRAGPSLGVTLEVVYGHAWVGEQRRGRESPGEIGVPITAIRGRR